MINFNRFTWNFMCFSSIYIGIHIYIYGRCITWRLALLFIRYTINERYFVGCKGEIKLCYVVCGFIYVENHNSQRVNRFRFWYIHTYPYPYPYIHMYIKYFCFIILSLGYRFGTQYNSPSNTFESEFGFAESYTSVQWELFMQRN